MVAQIARKPFSSIGCIITDVKIPETNGLDLQDTINCCDAPMPVIFITGHGGLPMSVGAMKKGTVDFLAKPFDDEALIDAIATALEKCR